MEFSNLLVRVQGRPGAYGLNGSYREYVAFINGCDAIRDWSLLGGFREWLARRLGHGMNLVWWELVRQIAVAERGDGSGEPEESILIDRMFELIDEFLIQRASNIL